MIKVDYKSPVAIYEQIKNEILALIVKGVFKKDDQLPSVRFLAQELSVNPNTIQKAYSDLEKDGITYSVKGRGSFVNLSGVEVSERYEPILFSDLEHSVIALLDHAVVKSRIEEYVETVIEEYEKNDRRGEMRND